MKLEVCANSFNSASNAEKGGAAQIELCSELSIGGVTPSYGLIEKVLKSITIPVNVLIRPRGGNFYYSEDEFEIIKNDIKICKKLGCAGIVTGILTANNHLDLTRMEELINLSRPMRFSFHRAFDLIPDPIIAMENLLKLEVNAILSSGQSQTAIEGIEILKELLYKSQGKIIIMPGGGINGENAPVFKSAGFNIVHASASGNIVRDKDNKRDIPYFGNYLETVSDLEEIKKIVSTIT